ncbi:MAG: EAL domain-containing protein, partial [Azospira sp.]|nr:EAL domain-containing protein [Azospira sp.]
HDLSTSVSIGVSLFPDDGGDFDTLLKKADTAMYRAKGAGRNGYRFFDREMDKDVGERLRLSNDLRLALARNEFVLHYQPQIDLRTQEVIGAEALIRWQHPELGLLAPGRFIGIAEDTGLIVPIGEWVIRMACHQAAAWQRAGLPPLVVAVNLSAVQFMRGDLVGTVASALATSALPSRCLELELTESILIQDAENILGTVQRLNAIGVQMSIDDFGTGYSSLSYLKRFAVDKLKVDQSFVRDLCSDPDDAAIVRAIIQLARSLGLKTIAEGVETAEILALLQELGCDEAQGYYFAKPLPADNFSAFLSQRLS